jgi:hypothetical protein
MEDKLRIQEIPGKGLGLVSTTLIPKGTRILSESPIFKLSSDSNITDHLVNKKIDSLSSTERESFFNLSNAYAAEYSQVVA